MSPPRLDAAFERAVLGSSADDFAFDESALDADLEFDLAMLGDVDPPSAELPTIAADAEFDAVMIGAGAVPIARPVVIPPPSPRVIVSQAPAIIIPEPKVSPKKWREFSFDFGWVWGTPGFRTVITVRPQCLFRAEKLMATDTYSSPGLGTSVIQVAVGQKIQRPGNAAQGTLTKFFAQDALADGITFDTSHAWESIALTVSFIQECTFYGSMFGSAEIE